MNTFDASTEYGFRKLLQSTPTMQCSACNGYGSVIRYKSFKKMTGDLKYYPGYTEYLFNHWNKEKRKVNTLIEHEKLYGETLKGCFMYSNILDKKDEMMCNSCQGYRHFKLTWPIGFEIKPDPYISKEDMDLVLAKFGWVCIEIEGQLWLFRTGLNKDFTWDLAYCQYIIQGHLTKSQMENISQDGDKYLDETSKKRLKKYLKYNTLTPEDYKKEYNKKFG